MDRFCLYFFRYPQSTYVGYFLTDTLFVFMLLYFFDFALISRFGCTESISVIFVLLVNSLVSLCNSILSMSFMGDNLFACIE